MLQTNAYYTTPIRNYLDTNQLVNGEVLANSAIHVFFSALDCISQNLVIAAICTKILRFNIFLKGSASSVVKSLSEMRGFSSAIHIVVGQ